MAVRPFEEVVAEHGTAVLRVCRATAGPDAAEDAWSETFLAAMRAYPALAEDSNVAAWLMTIARHKAIDQRQAQSRRPATLDGVAEAADIDVYTFGPEGGMWEAIRRLPPMQRRAIAYHYVAGLPYAEVATLLGGSEAAARRAAADGMKRLRQTIRKGDER